MSILLFGAENILLTAADVMDYNYGIEKTDNGNIFLIIVLLISLFAYKRRAYIVNNNDNGPLLYNANYVSVLLWIIRMVSRTVERVSLYFMPYTYVLLAESLNTLPKKEKGNTTFIVILLAMILFLYRMSYQMEINNFMFFWQ